MIKHVVLMKFEQFEHTKQVADEMMKLKNCRELIKDVATFTDFKHAANSYDLMVEFLFENEEDQIKFNSDETHVKVREKLMGYKPTTVKLDAVV